jgi:hypothetical protein
MSNVENNQMSPFLLDPGIHTLVAKRAGPVAPDVVASILNRPQPTPEEISKACANLYGFTG